MDIGESFALGFCVGFCLTILRATGGLYDIKAISVLIYSAATFAVTASILVLVPSSEDNEALLAYVTASFSGFALIGCTLLAKYLKDHFFMRM